jgi:pimeloyl-ACP methyl ester carboxylesterase
MPSRHCSRAAAAVLLLAGLQSVHTAPQSASDTAAGYESNFLVYFRSVLIGRENVSVSRTADGWAVASSGVAGAPFNLVARRVQLRYTPDWKPLELAIDATLGGQPLIGRTTIKDSEAVSVFNEGGKAGERKEALPDNTILLSSAAWAPFEALSQHLSRAAPGTEFSGRTFQETVDIQVGEARDETFQTSTRVMPARRTAITLFVNNSPLSAEVWSERSGHLLRVSIPSQNLEVVREDIASVAVRHVPISRPNDEVVRVPAVGFSLAATISKPERTGGRMPAVVLVSGSGPTDRDEILFGISIFGELANALADQGVLVVRYDKRGIGQSGGRPEAATLVDYADDVRAVVRMLRDRKDVDKDRITLIGYGEGGPVALVAARDGSVAALAMIAAMGVPGHELTMWQARHRAERSGASEDSQKETLDLQERVQAAVLAGKGWEGIPPHIKAQADTAWFKSYLSFKPEIALRDVRKPVLVIQPLLDTETPPFNADQFEAMAGRTKHRQQVIRVVRVPNVNHLLVPAATGEADEYAKLADTRLSSAVVDPLVAWLKEINAAAH